jgi:hypothetical protein
MFLPINQEDITIRKLVTNKEWSLNETDVNRYYGVSSSYFDVFDLERYNGVYPELLYSNIRMLYYYNSATGSANDYGYRSSSLSTDERTIGDTIVVLSVPNDTYGERIQRGTLTLTSASLTLTDDGFSNLKDGNEIVGNIFYEHGLVVLTKNIDTSSYQTYEMSFNSTHTIYEREIFISIPESQFNVSTNPSATYELDGAKYIRKDFISFVNPTISGSFNDYFDIGLSSPTGSYLTPYITTIGLYNSSNELLLVGKLARPIKKLPDYPMNFIIRYDM